MRLSAKRITAIGFFMLLAALVIIPDAFGQGVTRSAMSGIITDEAGQPLPGANVVALHIPSGTQYGTATRVEGNFNIPNMRIGGPYRVTVSFIGFDPKTEEDVYLSLGQNLRLDFVLSESAVQLDGVTVTGDMDEVLNANRTGAATFVSAEQVAQLPSVKRSTRDLVRLDPRNDGNLSFGGRNWLYNNISLDGSYFNNPFGLDDPAPGGQAGAEPVPFESVEQVQVSIAPFDVREGGFTGANVNTVTKSGTNEFKGSVYTYMRNEDLVGNKINGQTVVANPDLTFNQSGFTISGPIIKNKLFFFVNGEMERRDDPGTNFVADRDGDVGFGESRVQAATMDEIRRIMKDVYGYETGAYDNYVHETNNDKLLVKLNWNISDKHDLSLRWNYLDAKRDLGPNATVLSVFNSGRGPNSSSLPFQNSGYAINNELNSYALELNSRGSRFSNRFFASYNRFRDFRSPNSVPFPTIEIGEAGVTYTTIGHEPFSIHNILDQDVLQLTNNFSYFAGKHVLTAGANFETFSFFNSFNIFRHGVFFLPHFVRPIGSTFFTLEDFYRATDPANTDDFIDFNEMVATGPFKGEEIDVGQLSVYAQDEFLVNDRFNLTYGLRVDFPMYFTDPVDNPFSRELTALDENGNAEVVDQSELPGASPLFSPRVGFNWDIKGDRTSQLRGGTGIFTGRVPFVWIGNVISNPGENPNIWSAGADNPPAQVPTSDDSILQQSFDLNAMDPDFKFPQIWTTNVAFDQELGNGLLATVELLFGKDINAVVMRNSDLRAPIRTLNDGRPYYGGLDEYELNPDGGAGIYVIDNTDEGYNFNATAQLRKAFASGLQTNLAYSFTQAENKLKSTEIASVLWQNQPVQGNPNSPALARSEFGHRHRIIASSTYQHRWSENASTSIGLFFEAAEGNQFIVSGGNRYSFIYSGDVNGDGQAGNDLIYIPTDAFNASEIKFADRLDNNGGIIATAFDQAQRFEAFIEQDNYLSENRGKIAERFGAVNPWYSNLDLKIIQDLSFNVGSRKQTIQLNLDILNVGNLLNSDWGVRKVANPAATSPLSLVRFDDAGQPVFNFTGPSETYIEDPSLFSRWQVQFGVKYMF